MAALIDTGNIAHGLADYGGATTATFNLTVGASDNFLVVLEANSQASTAQAPSSVTYNGVALTLLSGSSKTLVAIGDFEVSTWYMANPPTGAVHSLVATYGTAPQFCCATAIPMSGVNTASPFGSVTSASSNANNVAALTVTGAGSNDLYLATAINGIETMTASGANQTNLVDTGNGSNASMTYDTVPGADAGVFSWTGSGTVWGNGWLAAGVAVIGTAVSSAAIAWVT